MKRVRRQKGQSLVEFAFALPLFMMLVFVTIQLSLLFIAYYSETRMARETSRWLAINRNALDTAVGTHVQTTMLPGLVSGTPTSPTVVGNTATVYVGRMKVDFTTCGAATAPCTNANRAPASTVTVTMTYDASNLIFLPSTFRFGWLTTRIPTSLPAYSVSTMVE
jgi:Flp pilus assembly protein TadG